MQNLIACLILLAAAAYLLLKWMPAPLKTALTRSMEKLSPGLARLFTSTAKACASGCSSCGGCDTAATPIKNKQGKPVIPIKRL